MYQFPIFKNVQSKAPIEEKWELRQVVSQIRSGVPNSDVVNKIRKLRAAFDKNLKKTAEYDEIKKTILSFVPSVDLEKGRKSENIIKYNQVVVLDIDHISDQGVDLEVLKEKIVSSPYTLCSFISPGGDGLKILIKVDSKLEVHKHAFNQLKKCFSQELGVEIDKSGSDCARLCIFSFDEEVYLNEDSKVFNISMMMTLDERIKIALEKTEGTGIAFEKGLRNTFILRFGSFLCRHGVSKSEALQYSVINYEEEDFPETEIERTLNSAYRNNEPHFGKYSNYGYKVNKAKKEEAVVKTAEKLLLLPDGEDIELLALIALVRCSEEDDSLWELAARFLPLIEKSDGGSQYHSDIIMVLKSESEAIDEVRNKISGSLDQEQFNDLNYPSIVFHKYLIQLAKREYEKALSKGIYSRLSELNKLEETLLGLQQTCLTLNSEYIRLLIDFYEEEHLNPMPG